MNGWNHDDVVRLLARETIYSHADMETVVLRLAALGWTPHQVRRGILTASRVGLPFDSLWRGVELAGGNVDRFLDALVSADLDTTETT